VGALASSCALETEREGALPQRVFDAAVRSGLYTFMLPRELGGLEADPPSQLLIFEAVSRADTTLGWCVGIAAAHAALAGAFLAEHAVAAMFDGGMPFIAGQYAPRHVATITPGGYRASGQWSFASGSRHATWFMCGLRVERPGAERPEVRMAFVPRRDVELIDNWQVAGLQGTASCDYVLRDVEIEEGFTFDQIHLAARRGGPSYRLPSMGTYVAPFHCGIALGAARRALDEVTALAAGKRRRPSGAALAERGSFQVELAKAEVAVRSARAFALDAIGGLWDTVRAGTKPSTAQRALVRLATTHATDVSAAAITTAYRFGGGASIFLSHPLQRCLRDIYTATQHLAVGDDVYEQAGQIFLGIESKQHAFL
jgi:alkylation response protein AidB-like acyl-CoA dehydrogenase